MVSWAVPSHGFGLAVLIVFLAFCFGCRTYPQVTSLEGMQIIKRLVVACNARDPERLSRLEQDLKAFEESGKITSNERKTFDSIVTMARNGDWALAEKAALKLADDQVGNKLDEPRTK